MRFSQHARMLAGGASGLILGIAAQSLFGGDPRLSLFIRWVSQPIGQIFLRLLFMLVIPLVFSALALGVVGLGDLRRLGRLGAKTLAYTVVVSSIAVLIGVVLVNLLRPGERMSPELKTRLAAQAANRAAAVKSSSATVPKTGIDLLVNIVPDNVVKAAATGDLIGVIFFALFLGVGLATTKTESARRLEEALQGLLDVSMRLIGMVVAVAPIGVGALLFTLTAELGWEIALQLGYFVGVVVLGLAIHQFGIYSLSVKYLGGMSPIRFFRGVEEAMLTAFSTASSAATLPTSIRVAEESLRLPTHVSRFVLTVGSTLNQNGTALFEGVTVLFLAQFYGVSLDFGQQALVVGICILGGIGTAGVPAASLPVIALILGLIGVPIEGIGIVLGVDRFLDMCRTTLNVTGDLAAAVVVAKGEPLATEGASA